MRSVRAFPPVAGDPARIVAVFEGPPDEWLPEPLATSSLASWHAQDALEGALSVTFDVLLERDRANQAAWDEALAGSSADRPVTTAAGSTGERVRPA